MGVSIRNMIPPLTGVAGRGARPRVEDRRWHKVGSLCNMLSDPISPPMPILVQKPDLVRVLLEKFGEHLAGSCLLGGLWVRSPALPTNCQAIVWEK